MDLINEKKRSSALTQKNLRMEVNLGAALPVYSRMPKGEDKKNPHKAIVQLSEDDGSLKSLEIETRSDLGPLTPRDYSVLVSLIDIAYEMLNGPDGESVIQGNSYRVYVKYIDVCKKLGLDENSISHIKRSLKKIKSQEMRIKNFLYDGTSGAIKRIDEETNLILKMGKYLLGDTKDSSGPNYYAGIYIDLDSFIVDSMLAENVSLMNRNIFLDLPSGPARRMYSYFTSKRTIFGNQYTVKLSEIAALVGKEPSYKTKEHLLEQLNKITSSSGIQFTTTKDSGVMDWSILVTFMNDDTLAYDENNFYRILLSEYNNEIFENYELDEILLENYVNELTKKFKKVTGEEFIEFRKGYVLVGEFVVDVLVHRISIGISYPKSFRAYAGKMVESLIDESFELPEKYRKFIRERIKDRSKKEIQETIQNENVRAIRLEEEEKEKLELNFNNFFDNILVRDKKLYSELEDYVIDEMSRTCSSCFTVSESFDVGCSECHSTTCLDENYMMYNLEFENRIRKYAFEMFKDGSLMDNIHERSLNDSSVGVIDKYTAVKSLNLQE